MTLFHHLGIVAASGGVAAAPGMVLLTPSSITHSGTSASIGANGQVTFTAVTSLSLNGVFSADFDNYVVSVRSIPNTGINFQVRLRASGTDASGASDYVRQQLDADGTSVTASRTTDSSWVFMRQWDTAQNGQHWMLYGPALAQPTATRVVNVHSELSAHLRDVAGTHSQSVSYDGFTLDVSAGNNSTGALQVYGVRS